MGLHSAMTAEPLEVRIIAAREESLARINDLIVRSKSFWTWPADYLEKALPLHEKALLIYRKVLGEEHPHTATSPKRSESRAPRRERRRHNLEIPRQFRKTGLSTGRPFSLAPRGISSEGQDKASPE